MVVEIRVSLTAQMIDGHYEELDGEKKYLVEEIMMGQFHTSLSLENIEGSFNSVHFKFYIGNKEVDIYKSGLFNHYITFSENPAVFYIDKDKENAMTWEQLRNLKTIVDTYGAEPQMDMMIEESSELTKALLKYRRKSNSDPSTGEEMTALRGAIIDEIADVKIMLAQMEILFGCEGEVDFQVERKIERQMDRLTKRKGERSGNY